MGILSIMHKLHDPFNSYHPSDPKHNSPSLLPSVCDCCTLFSHPHGSRRECCRWSPVTETLLPFFIFFFLQPNFYNQTNSNSAALKLHAEGTEKQRKLGIKYPLCFYCQSPAQTIVCVIPNMHSEVGLLGLTGIDFVNPSQSSASMSWFHMQFPQ